MSKPWRRTLIKACKASILEILREVEAADDLDLWEEADGKLTDVILTYRRAQQQQAAPATFTFSDGVTRNLDEMAYTHALHASAEEFPDLDQDDEFPAFMGRGEAGARWPSNSSYARTAVQPHPRNES